MINPLLAYLTATVRAAGATAQDAVAKAARRAGLILVAAILASAALIAAAGFFTAAAHRAVASATSPLIADLAVAGAFVLIALILLLVVAAKGRARGQKASETPPAWRPARAAGGESEAAPSAGQGTRGRNLILGAVFAAFLIGLGLGRR